MSQLGYQVVNEYLLVAPVLAMWTRKWRQTRGEESAAIIWCYAVLVLVVLVGYGQCLVEDFEAFGYEIIVNMQRWHHVDAVEVGKHNEAKFFTLGDDLSHGFGTGSVWCQGFLGFLIGDQFDCPETTHAADVADGRVCVFEPLEARSDDIVS